VMGGIAIDAADVAGLWNILKKAMYKHCTSAALRK
jgi:uncharacterized membrane protein